MDLSAFIAEVVIITSSGALSPGPLTVATLSEGAKKGWTSGILVALGHTAVELPLLVVLALGLSSVVYLEGSRSFIALLGGASLLAYSLAQFRDAVRLWRGSVEVKAKAGGSGSFYVGVALSAFNPLFLAWWATVGVKLIADALEIFENSVVMAVTALYASHVWMDYAWLTLLSYLGYKGRELGPKTMAVILTLSSAILVYFSAVFLLAGMGLC